jgi:hypothetical protein
MLNSYFIAAIVKGFDGKHYEKYYATDNASGGCPYMSLCINNSAIRRFDTFDEAKNFLKRTYQFKENKLQFDGCDSNDLIDGPYIVKLECKKVNL